MLPNDNVQEGEETPTPPEAPAPETVGGDGVESKRGTPIMIKHTNGVMEKRADFIRRRYYDDKISRSQIRAELKTLGHECAYQVIFSATKDKTKPTGKRAIATQRAAAVPPPPPPPPAAAPQS